MKSYSVKEVETALCLWEAFIDGQLETCHDGRPTEYAEQLCEMRSQHGSFTVRHAIMALVEDAEIAWEALQAMEGSVGHICFDFEFCPMFLRGKIENGDLGLAAETQWRVVA